METWGNVNAVDCVLTKGSSPLYIPMDDLEVVLGPEGVGGEAELSVQNVSIKVSHVKLKSTAWGRRGELNFWL